MAFGGTCERVRSGVMDMINKERSGAQIDRDQIKSCVEVFVVMGLAQINHVQPAVFAFIPLVPCRAAGCRGAEGPLMQAPMLKHLSICGARTPCL